MSYEVEFGSYWENEDFQCCGYPEPHIRSQNIIFRCKSCKWHVRFTFKGVIIRENDSSAVIKAQKQRQIRRQQLQVFIKFIKFEQLDLIKNTVTEVEFVPASGGESVKDSNMIPLRSDLPAENGYSQFKSFRYRSMEDQSMVVYPSLAEGLSEQTVPLSDITTVAKVGSTTTRVTITSHPAKREYIFKSIDRPRYLPRDTRVLERELQNLQLFRQSPYIIHLASIVTSTNPYHTGGSGNYNVLRGVLLEYHPKTLEASLEIEASSRWRRWPGQIARGLKQLHEQQIAHMDLKPSNIVISAQNEAVIIDISGLEYTCDWISDEIREAEDPMSLPFADRQNSDIWAFGKLLSTMVRLESDVKRSSLLQEVVNGAMERYPFSRLRLDSIISQLDQILEQN